MKFHKHYFILIFILFLATYLRLINITDNPFWYTDEVAHLNMAQSLANGEVRYLAVNQSVLMFGRLPLFQLVLAGAINLLGDGITTLRTLTALLGVLSVGLIYILLSMAQLGLKMALLTAFIAAIYPQMILYNRFGFSYNLLAPLVLLLAIGLIQYHQTGNRRWVILAALSIGFGLISDLAMGAFILPFILIVAWKRPLDVIWSLPLVAIPFGLYALIMLLAVPDAFIADLSFTLSRLNQLSFEQQIDTVVQNFEQVITRYHWMPLGVIGLLFLRPIYVRNIILLLILVPFVFLGRTVALFNLSFYYNIPLLPLLAIGVASGLYAIINQMQKKDYVWAIVLIGCIGFITPSLIRMVDNIHNGYITEIEPFLVQPDEARAVAAYINGETLQTDIVITTPAVAWMLDAQAADFQMMVAVTGVETVHMPANIPEERFAFKPYYQNAKFIVVDNLWRNWGVIHVPTMDEISLEIAAWPIVFEVGTMTVYQNPDL